MTFREECEAVCRDLVEMLVEKNARYGDSALNPLRVFSRAGALEQIDVRLDDKLSRLARGTGEENEDVRRDLLGYLVLREVALRRGGECGEVPHEMGLDRWAREVREDVLRRLLWWVLCDNHVGASSSTIVARLIFGVPRNSDDVYGDSVPLDEADLDRCRRLLSQVPELRAWLPDLPGKVREAQRAEWEVAVRKLLGGDHEAR